MRFLRFIPIGIVAVMAMSRAVNYRSVQSPEPFTPPKQHTFPINPDKLNLIKQPPAILQKPPAILNWPKGTTTLDRPDFNIVNFELPVNNRTLPIFTPGYGITSPDDAFKSEVSFGLPEKPQVEFGNSDDYTFPTRDFDPFPNRDFDPFPNRFPITPGGSSNDDIAIPESSDDSEDNDSTPPVLEPETVPDDKEATTSETPTEETITPAEETTTPAEEVIDTNNQP